MKTILLFSLLITTNAHAIATGTKCLLDFEEASGTALDTSGNGYSWTLSGSPDPGRATTPAAAHGTKWLASQNTTSQLNAPAGLLAAMSGAGFWAVEYYENWTDVSTLPTWFTDNALTFWIQHQTQGIRLSCNGVLTGFYNSAPVNAASTSYMVAYTYNGVAIKLYVCALGSTTSTVLQTTTSGSASIPSLATLRIGGSFAAVNMKVDYMRISVFANAGLVPTSFPTIDPSTGRSLRLNRLLKPVLGALSLFEKPAYAYAPDQWRDSKEIVYNNLKQIDLKTKTQTNLDVTQGVISRTPTLTLSPNWTFSVSPTISTTPSITLTSLPSVTLTITPTPSKSISAGL